MPQMQAVNSLGGFASTASIDSELRQRATHTTYFEQMTLIAASYGKHRSSSLLLDKLGRLATPMNQNASSVSHRRGGRGAAHPPRARKAQIRDCLSPAADGDEEAFGMRYPRFFACARRVMAPPRAG